MQNIGAVGWSLFPSPVGLSSLNAFGDFSDFLKTTTTPDTEQSPNTSDEISPTGTFSYDSDAKRVSSGIVLDATNYKAADVNEEALIFKVTENEARRSYSRWTEPKRTIRKEEYQGSYKLPDYLKNGTLSIDASNQSNHTDIDVSQDSSGNTQVQITDTQSGDKELYSFGRIARIEVTGSAQKDNILVSGRNFVGGIDIDSGADADTISINTENTFNTGLDIDSGAGDDIVSLTAANSNVEATGGADDDILSMASTNLASRYILTAYGGTGNDNITGSKWRDTLYGEDGNDIIFGGEGADTVYGGAGNDYLSGQGGSDLVYGGAGNDTLIEMPYNYINTKHVGVSDNDSLWGEEGADEIIGGGGDDSLNGGDGDDHIYGGPGQDTLSGGAGDDWLYGGAGRDILRGGAGADYFAPMLDDSYDQLNQDNATNCIADYSATDPDTIADLTTLECRWTV